MVNRYLKPSPAGSYTCQADMNQKGALDESHVTKFVGALLDI